MVTADRTRRPPRFGPEPWRDIAGETWSLWDLWFCVLAVADHDGDLDRLDRHFVDALRSPGGLYRRRGNEAKLSHLRDLGARLTAVALVPADLVPLDSEELRDPTLISKARDKVLRQSDVEGRAATPAMIDTRRRVLSRRARYGHWAHFPSDPAQFFERFRPAVERKGFVSKGQTFAITERLQRRLGDLDGPRRTLPDRFALYRAFHAAGLELADIADDSYGAIGQLRTDAWHTYLHIDWRATGIDPAVYWQDLCELIIWEPYAVDHQAETAWFSTARVDEVDVIETVLLDLEREHRDAVLDFEADIALERLTDLYIATSSRDRFPRAARRLGSRAWRPIEQMARALLETGERDAAVEIFRAADQPGMHQAHLRRRCHELTGAEVAAPTGDRT